MGRSRWVHPNYPADKQRCTGPHSLFYVIKRLYIVTPIVLGLCTITFGVLIHRLYVQFGWAVFYLVGASPEIKRECET